MTRTCASGTCWANRSSISEMFAASLWVGTMMSVRTRIGPYRAVSVEDRDGFDSADVMGGTTTAAITIHVSGAAHANRDGQSGPAG